MHDPRKTANNQPAAESATARKSTGQLPQQRRKRAVWPWLFVVLLALLVVLLAVRDDLRQSLTARSENAAHYLAFDLLGWSPRTVFVWRLRLAGLLDSPLGQQWIGAVERASEKPIAVADQYRTSKTFAADQIEAHIYQLALQQGEKILWQLSRLDASDNRLYASLQQYRSDSGEWSNITQLDADGTTQSRTVAESADYRIVLQPELFAKVEYSLALASGGSLLFPVENASPRDIGGGFGAPRGGGARAHHGVDIFAKRGTPVRAVVAGRVRTGTAGIGGKHLWLTGSTLGLGGARYYYAHLDSFAVESGDKVQQGEILGYVGNTGNAKNTPPHLHFGIYAAGPVDPMPFLKPQPVLPEG